MHETYKISCNKIYNYPRKRGVKMARLGDMATFINGYAFKPSDWSDVGLPIIRIQDLTGNSYQANRFNGDYDPKYEIVSGDVLISWSASLGVYVWSGEKALLNQHIFKVVFDKVDVDKNFFIYQLESILEKAKSEAHGATMKHLTKPVFEALTFYLPSKDEQVRISTELNKVNRLIELRKQQLQKLDEFVKSRFIEMFGTVYDNKFDFEIKTLQDVSEPIKDGTHQTPTYTDDKVNGYKFLSSKDVVSGKIDWEHLKYIPEELHKDLYARITPQKGDILLAKNGTTGISAVVDREETFDIYVSLALIRPIEINSLYLWCAINSAETKRQFDASLKGIGVPNLHLGEIKKTKIIVPPIELQNQFATFVEQTDKLKFEVKQSLEKLETLKKSLMQQYFG